MEYHCYGIINSSKYLGTVEADSKEEAIEKASGLDSCYVSICHQCSREVNDPEISHIEVDPKV